VIAPYPGITACLGTPAEALTLLMSDKHPARAMIGIRIRFFLLQPK
jgi:hypothetical protein